MKNNIDDYKNEDYDIAVGMVKATIAIYIIGCLTILIYFIFK